jgi:prepilin-type N-terminal cleavage/methylation domain-containing protein
VDGLRDDRHHRDDQGELTVRRLHRIARREDGLTLVELLVALPLLGILLMAMTLALTTTTHWGNQVQEDSVIQTESRSVIDGIAKDLRQAHIGNFTAPIESLSPTTITFDSPDRTTPFHLRRISYRLLNGQLDRQSSTSTNTVAPWTFPATPGPWSKQLGSVMNSAAFSYFDAAGAPTTDPNAVLTVKLSFTISTGSSQGRRFTYTSTVNLRQV